MNKLKISFQMQPKEILTSSTMTKISSALVTLDQNSKYLLLCLILKPEKATEQKNKNVLDKIGINENDINQCYGISYFFKNKTIKKDGTKIIIEIIKSILNITDGNSISESMILNTIFNAIRSDTNNYIGGLTNVNYFYNTLEYINDVIKDINIDDILEDINIYFGNGLEDINELLKQLKSNNPSIKKSKNIDEKINLFLQKKSADTLVWKIDKRKQILNYEGICAAYSLDNINLAILKQDKHTNQKAIDDIKKAKYLTTKSEFLSAIDNAKAIKTNYAKTVYTKQKNLLKKYGFKKVESLAFHIDNFDEAIKEFINEKSLKINQKLLFDLTIPHNEICVGHSTYLSITLKSIGGEEYYSLDVHDSNYRQYSADNSSYSRNLLISKNKLSSIKIPYPLYTTYGNHAALELYENSNNPHKYKKSLITIDQLKENLFTLEDCDIETKLKYLNSELDISTLSKKNSNGDSLANLILMDSNDAVKLEMLKIFKDQPDLLLEQDKNGNSIASLVCKCSDNLKLRILDMYNVNPQLLFSKNTNNDMSIADFILKGSNDDIKLKILEICASNLSFLDIKDESGFSIAHKIIANSSVVVILKLLDLAKNHLEILSNRSKCTEPLLISILACSVGEKFQRRVLTFVKQTPAFFYLKDTNGISVAHFLAISPHEIIHKEMLEFFVDNREHRGILYLETNNKEIVINMINTNPSTFNFQDKIKALCE